MFNFTIFYHEDEIASAEAERYEDARGDAIIAALKGPYSSSLPFADFMFSHSTSATASARSPLML